MAILHDAIGIEKQCSTLYMDTLQTKHSWMVQAKKDLREGRAAAQNIVPSSTGAAIAGDSSTS